MQRSERLLPRPGERGGLYDPAMTARPALTLVAICACLLAACDDGHDTTTVTDTRPETETVTSTTATTETRCSASGLEIELPAAAGVPAAVATTRRQLFDAATGCDFKRLGELAARSEQFSYTFGLTDDDPAGHWERTDKRDDTLRILAQVLTAPRGVVRDGDQELHVWPSAQAASPTEADWRALARTGAYTTAEIDRFRTAGGYYGFRVGILDDGTWIYFIAGD